MAPLKWRPKKDEQLKMHYKALIERILRPAYQVALKSIFRELAL